MQIINILFLDIFFIKCTGTYSCIIGAIFKELMNIIFRYSGPWGNAKRIFGGCLRLNRC